MITKNPFTSKTFTKIWAHHFNNDEVACTFNFIKNISFFKPKKHLPLYINIGENLTKGVSYTFNKVNDALDFKNKVFLIYDVPQYFKVEDKNNNALKIKTIKQYPGYLINLDNYTDFEDYAKKTFSKSSNQKLKRYNKRLEICFDITHKMLIGNVDKGTYDFVFNHFNQLLTKRFEEKKITNNNLHPDEWNFYYHVAYPLILEEKAGLHVIYNGDTPISVRLLYFSETIIFDAITVFDIDYSKFHIGKISIMEMLKWSFKSHYKIFDFSKGYFDYKESWSDKKYNFNYHILYDSKALAPTLTAYALSYFFKLKQFLRDKDINNKLHKLNFLINSKKNKTQQNDILELQEETIPYTQDALTKIDINTKDYSFLKKPAFDLLFLSSEHQKNLETYKMEHPNKVCFLLKTPSKSKIVCL